MRHGGPTTRRGGRLTFRGDLMSSKSPLPSQGRKATDGKKRTPAYRGRNGNGNGNGHGEGDAKASAAPGEAQGQPSRGEMGFGRVRPTRDLDHKTLLAVL